MMGTAKTKWPQKSTKGTKADEGRVVDRITGSGVPFIL
jgi:hypothetical protein